LRADSKSAELKILASYWLAQGFDRFLWLISDAACCMRHQELGQRKYSKLKEHIRIRPGLTDSCIVV
jgi:hypothetical protein